MIYKCVTLFIFSPLVRTIHHVVQVSRPHKTSDKDQECCQIPQVQTALGRGQKEISKSSSLRCPGEGAEFWERVLEGIKSSRSDPAQLPGSGAQVTACSGGQGFWIPQSVALMCAH